MHGLALLRGQMDVPAPALNRLIHFAQHRGRKPAATLPCLVRPIFIDKTLEVHALTPQEASGGSPLAEHRDESNGVVATTELP